MRQTSFWIKVGIIAYLCSVLFLAPHAIWTHALHQPPSICPTITSAKADKNEALPPNVEPSLLHTLMQTGKTDFWIEFVESADLQPAQAMDWQTRGQFVYDALQKTAAQSQAETRVYLTQHNIKHTPHWIVNAIYVENEEIDTLRVLSQNKAIHRLRSPRTLHIPKPTTEETPNTSLSNLSPAWNLTIIQAPEAWAAYTRGEGIVVANIDTGVRYTHEALRDQYRGNLGEGTYNHNYNWYDPQGSPTPYDENGHGTHTMGTMVGDDGASNQIGVAPGAVWIAADGCDGYDCPDEDLISSGEWILAPCPIGSEPGSATCDPNMRPHIVNNSWGDCETTTTDFFESVIDAWRASGIYTTFSSGNSTNCKYQNAFCGSLSNPARHYQVTSVGATDQSDVLAYFSLWGPTDDPDPRLATLGAIKPELTAPGVAISSSSNSHDASYAFSQGTSMASPHVAGTAALVLAANTGIIGHNDLLEDILKETADPKPYTTTCGVEGPGGVPNNAYGWGRVNAYQAAHMARTAPNLTIFKETATAQVMAGVPLTYTLTISNSQGVATGITVQDRLPTHTTFITASNGGLLVGDDIYWDGLALKRNSYLTLTLSLSATCDAINTTITNTLFQASAAEWQTPTTNAPIAVAVITPTVHAEFTSQGAALKGIPTHFINQSQRAKAAYWDFGDGTASTVIEPHHTYTKSGTYTVGLTATGYCGQQSTITHTLVVLRGIFLPLVFK